MTVVKILFCDDEAPRGTGVLQRLRRRLGNSPRYEVSAVSSDGFVQAIGGLEKRQLRARDSAEMAWSTNSLGDDLGDHPFDNIDILFVDYDLARLSSKDGPSVGGESGERVCYLARCYSTCGIIVGYNQFSYRSAFDLTLRGHIRSYADLNISIDQAANAGLWTHDYTGFRPWSWPMLTNAQEQLTRCADAVADSLTVPILEALGLNGDEIYTLFSREQLEFLSPKLDPRRATFEDFVRDSSLGLRPKDLPYGRQSTARIAAARIGKWIERAILPHQNILVDAPHLISRFPSLIPEPHTEDRWNAPCRLTVPPEELGIDSARIQPYEFVGRDWLSRPTWIWPRLAVDDNIREVSDPWSPRAERLVFCEDVSRFRPRRSAFEFDADVSPEFGRRYIQKLKNIDYVPTVRLLVSVPDA